SESSSESSPESSSESDTETGHQTPVDEISSEPLPSSSEDPNFSVEPSVSESDSESANYSDDPEESGQSVIVDNSSETSELPSPPGSEVPTDSDNGNYVDYEVNSNGEISSSIVEDPNLANQANAPSNDGVKTNQMAVIIVLVIGGIALVGAAIAWYIIRRKKQAIRRQNNWDMRESMKPLPNGMRMTADL
ncbi:hypothetical protein IWW36_005862, partial [Coemansia brasiliensis]